MKKLVLTVHFELEENETTVMANASGGGVKIRPLHGYAIGGLFRGTIGANSVNIQIVSENGVRRMNAHFVLVGKDTHGVPSRIYVENDGWFNGSIANKFRTSPTLLSDNPSLASYFGARTFIGEGVHTDSGVEMRFFEVDETPSASLSAHAIADLSRYEYVHFNKNDYIIRQGAEVDYAYFLVSGKCKVSNLSYKGDTIVYDMRHADRSIRCFLGVLSSYRLERVHRTSFIAYTECYCYRLSRDDIRGYMLEHPDVLDAFMSLVMERYALLEDNYFFKQARNTPGQVCSAIMTYMEFREGMYWMSPEMTNTKISRLTGANRVTVVRIVQELTRMGLLEKTADGTRITDIDAMNAIVRGDKQVKYNRAKA